MSFLGGGNVLSIIPHHFNGYLDMMLEMDEYGWSCKWVQMDMDSKVLGAWIWMDMDLT